MLSLRSFLYGIVGIVVLVLIFVVVVVILIFTGVRTWMPNAATG